MALLRTRARHIKASMQSGWDVLSPLHHCSWEGVACDHAGFVTSM
jgi:hypothetical protein